MELSMCAFNSLYRITQLNYYLNFCSKKTQKGGEKEKNSNKEKKVCNIREKARNRFRTEREE